MQFAKDGICMGCKTYEAKARITDQEYLNCRIKLESIIKQVLEIENIKHNNYDCIVSVSGEKIHTTKHIM